MRTSRHGPAHLLASLAVLFCMAMTVGCASGIGGHDESRSGHMETSVESKIVEIAPQGSALEYTAPDADDRGRVSVSLSKAYERSESVEVYETADGTIIELPTTTVRMGDGGFDLQITVDDAGYLDWWCNGSVSEYAERAMAERFNSSWQINVDGREGIVLVQGSASSGGEISGEAFVFLDRATVWFSAVPIDGKVLETDAYSRFFSSPEVRNLLDSVSISER